MHACPFGKEWDNLVLQSGSKKEATKIWIANGFKVPLIEAGTRDRNRNFSLVVRNNRDSIKSYQDQIHNNDRLRKETTDEVLRSKLNLSNQELDRKIEELKDQNLMLGNVTIDPRDVVALGMEQIDKIRKYLNDPKLDEKTLSRHVTTVKLWQKFSNLSEDSLFFTKRRLDEMMKDEEFKRNIAYLNQEANLASNDIFTKTLQLLEKHVINSFYEPSIKKEILKRMKQTLESGLKDVSSFNAYFLSIDHYDNIFYDILVKFLIKADFESNKEAEDFYDELDEKLKNLSGEKLELYKQVQSNKDSRETGDLTVRTTQSWFNKLRDIREVFSSKNESSRRLVGTKKDESLNKAYRDMIKGYSKIVHVIDLRQLFSEDAVERTKYEEYIKGLAGVKGFEFYKQESKKKYDEFVRDSKDILLDYQRLNPDTAEQYYENWQKSHNPKNNAIYVNKGFSEKGFQPRPNFKYTQMIPNNKEDYDNKFKQIENDPELLDIHNYLLKTIDRLKSYLPSEEARNIHMNTIPDVAKDMLEKFTEDGVLSTASSLYDKLIESTRTSSLASTVDSVDLEVSGKMKKNFQFPLLVEHRKAVSDYVKFKTTEYIRQRAEWVKEPADYKDQQLRRQQRNAEIRNLIPQWRAEKLDEIVQNKSWDLRKVFRVMGSVAITYKHRAKVEDPVRMVNTIMDKNKEIITNPAGEILKTSATDIARKQGLSKQLESFNYWEDIFYGYPSRAPQGVMTKKVLTPDEKAIKKQYEDEIEKITQEYEKGNLSQDEFSESLSTLYTQLDELGGYRTWSAIGDDFLAYMQLKGIGWNVFSAFSNLGFGLISNMIEAADGRKYTMKEFMTALTMSLNSVGRSASFGIYETPTAKKIHNLMKRLDVLKDNRNEIYDSRKHKLKSGFDAAMPFTLQTRTEFINQSTMMIAMMKHKKVKVDDKEMTLWDAYDIDGNLSEHLRDTEVQMKIAIDESIEDAHGNYDNLHKSMLLKKYFFGRAFIQFKTWAVMGFHNRFSGDEYSSGLGYNKRGRYRSYARFYKDLGPLHGTFEITKQLLRKLIGNTEFDNLVGENNQFDETDAANMRKNLQEIVVYMSLMGIALLLKNLLSSDDDEPTDLKFITMFLLNTTNRLQTDIMFYTNPIEFQKLQRQAIPLFQVVTDAYRLTNHMGELILGESDLYQTGIYSGQSKTKRYAYNLIPLLVSFNRISSITEQKVWD